MYHCVTIRGFADYLMCTHSSICLAMQPNCMAVSRQRRKVHMHENLWDQGLGIVKPASVRLCMYLGAKAKHRMRNVSTSLHQLCNDSHHMLIASLT